MKRLSQLLAGATLIVIFGAAFSNAYAQSSAPRALFAYPIHGQTLEQENADRAACHDWAVAQTGYDPTPIYAAQQQRYWIKAPPSGASYEKPVFPNKSGGFGGALTNADIRRLNELYDAYLRAGQACLEGRGYQVSR